MPVNCSWFYNRNNQHVRGPVHVWRLRWAQSAVTVTGCSKYDCVVERMIGLLFVSWVQVFITFLHQLFKNHFHYVGVLSSTAARAKFSPPADGERRTWSHERRVNEAGQTYPRWNDAACLQLFATFLWGPLEKCFYDFKNVRLSSWRQRRS